MSQESRGTPLLSRLSDKFQYLSDNCSLQWLGYVLTPYPTPLIKRLFWLATITGCCACSAVVLRGALSLYTSGAVSYSVETDYLEWDTPFPALTVCEYLNTGRVKKYLTLNNLPLSLETFSQEVSFWDKKICRTCTSCTVGEDCVEDFLEIVDGIRLKCPELLTKCRWNDEYFPCCERFLPVPTEYGTCFVFNSRWTGNETVITVNRRTGLPSLVFSAAQKINIRIHSPDDLITIASENILSLCSVLPRVTDLNIALKAEQIVSHVSVQHLSPDNRDCLFRNERPAFAPLWPFNQYSYSACVMYRRTVFQIDACNCSHHFMPQIGDYPKCDITGLACLNKLNKEISSNYYDCPMGCEEVSYEDLHVTCPRTTTNLSEELSRRGTQGHIRLSYLPTLRVRRHAIRELLGLVVDVGGVIGVFFGASLLSFIEIVYILFLRRYT